MIDKYNKDNSTKKINHNKTNNLEDDILDDFTNKSTTHQLKDYAQDPANTDNEFKPGGYNYESGTENSRDNLTNKQSRNLNKSKENRYNLENSESEIEKFREYLESEEFANDWSSGSSRKVLNTNIRFEVVQEKMASNMKALLKKIYGYQVTQAIRTFVELGIPDIMFDEAEPINIRVIKTKTKLEYRPLIRLLGFLVSYDILDFYRGQNYKLTEIGKLLSTKSPNSMSGVAMLHGSNKTKFYEHWLYLPWSIKRDMPATMLRNNRSIFNDLIVNPDAFNIFNSGMQSLLMIDKGHILNWYDFSKYNVIADIGAGSGCLLLAIMEKHKKVHGIFFDITNSDLKKRITDPEIVSRSEFITGNFLETAPFESDLYILRQILHNWDESTCLRILENIHKNMHKNSVLMIIDSLIDENNPSGKTILNHRNLQMFLLMDQGRERTDKDYLRICGHLFRFVEKQDLPSELSIIIAIPKGKF